MLTGITVCTEAFEVNGNLIMFVVSLKNNFMHTKYFASLHSFLYIYIDR